MKRFIETTAEAIGEEQDYPGCETKWWLDTSRPINDPQKFVAVQTEPDKDPNTFIKCENMKVLFTDQAEYYFVCPVCFNTHHHQQWSGSTRGDRNWRSVAYDDLDTHQKTKGWCEFCDPVFGNGGWCD